MTKKDKYAVGVQVEDTSVHTVPEASPQAPPPEKLSEIDKLSLDLARAKLQTAMAEAKTALANNENANVNYRYLILQLYMKYGLNQNDALNENGEIIRGGAVPQPQST